MSVEKLDENTVVGGAHRRWYARKLFVVICMVILLLGAAGGGYYWLNRPAKHVGIVPVAANPSGALVNIPTQAEVTQARAIQGGEGVLERVNTQLAVLKDAAGAPVTYHITADTQYRKGAAYAAGSLNEVKAGETVRITYDKTNNELLFLWYGL